MSDPVRIVIFQDEDQWVAQCLEHDVCTQAPDLETLHKRVLLTLQEEFDACVEAGHPTLDPIPPAPAQFFAMWDQRAKPFDQSGKTGGLAYELALVA